ncbi:hypothetical protein WN943_010602 [Citrus x changshan-huyou]
MFVCILLLVFFAYIFIRYNLRGLLIYCSTSILQSVETGLSEDQIDRSIVHIKGMRKKNREYHRDVQLIIDNLDILKLEDWLAKHDTCIEELWKQIRRKPRHSNIGSSNTPMKSDYMHDKDLEMNVKATTVNEQKVLHKLFCSTSL